jgi:outer membrane protein
MMYLQRWDIQNKFIHLQPEKKISNNLIISMTMLKKIAFILLLIAPMSVFAQKFGHIKSQEILTALPEYAKAQTDIQAMQQQYENEMKRAQEDFQKKYTEFQQEQANMPKNILERRQNELQQLSERAMQMQQDAQQDLQKSWMEMLEPIAKKIDDAIKAVGQEGGYVYIFDLNATQIPFVNETLSTDVTGAVKAKLGAK